MSVALSACCLKPVLESRRDSGTSPGDCAAAGGHCQVGPAANCHGSVLEAYDCNSSPPNPGGAVCCLPARDAGPGSTACLIGGSSYPDGEPNPLNPCQRCDLARDRRDWTDLVLGTACPGPGLCVAGTCAQGCLIDGGLVPPETTDPGGCRQCLPVFSETQWTELPNGVSCGDAGDPCGARPICAAGVCLSEPVTCDDQNVCTTDYCEKGFGCRNLDHAGDCTGTNPCKIYRCDPTMGCQQVDTADGTPCASSSPCVLATACLAGRCTGPAIPDGTPCRSPINPCVEDATCQAGLCESPTAKVLVPGDILWTDVARAFRGPDGGRVANPNATGFGWRGVASIDDLGNLYLDDDSDQTLPDLVSLDVCGKERWRVSFDSPDVPVNGRHLIFGTLIFSTARDSSIVGQDADTGATLWSVEPGATLGPNGTALPAGALHIGDVALSNQGIFYYTATWPVVGENGAPQIGRAIGGLLRNGQPRFQQVLATVPGDATRLVSFGYPLLVDEDENLYTGWRNDGVMEVVSFDGMGALRWTLPVSGSSDTLASFSEDHGLFVEPSPLMAFDANGTLLWSLGLTGFSNGHSPAVAVDGTTTILQTVGGAGQVTAFAEDGGALWTFNAPGGELTQSSHVLDSAGRLYFVGDHGTLFALDGTNGRGVWTLSMDPGLTIQRGVLGLTPAGSLIVSAIEQLTGVYAGAPMAASPWPRFRGDNRNRSCPTPADTPILPQ